MGQLTGQNSAPFQGIPSNCAVRADMEHEDCATSATDMDNLAMISSVVEQTRVDCMLRYYGFFSSRVSRLMPKVAVRIVVPIYVEMGSSILMMDPVFE